MCRLRRRVTVGASWARTPVDEGPKGPQHVNEVVNERRRSGEESAGTEARSADPEPVAAPVDG